MSALSSVSQMHLLALTSGLSPCTCNGHHILSLFCITSCTCLLVGKMTISDNGPATWPRRWSPCTTTKHTLGLLTTSMSYHQAPSQRWRVAGALSPNVSLLCQWQHACMQDRAQVILERSAHARRCSHTTDKLKKSSVTLPKEVGCFCSFGNSEYAMDSRNNLIKFNITVGDGKWGPLPH